MRRRGAQLCGFVELPSDGSLPCNLDLTRISRYRRYFAFLQVHSPPVSSSFLEIDALPCRLENAALFASLLENIHRNVSSQRSAKESAPQPLSRDTTRRKAKRQKDFPSALSEKLETLASIGPLPSYSFEETQPPAAKWDVEKKFCAAF